MTIRSSELGPILYCIGSLFILDTITPTPHCSDSSLHWLYQVGIDLCKPQFVTEEPVVDI